MLELIRSLAIPNTTKIVLMSLDGLGGLPRPETGKSELETARVPNLTALASEAACGLLRHVAPGITPGSGPGHLGLFGYDPLAYQVGRGVLEVARHRVRPARGGRGRTRELLHRGRRRPHHRPARGAHQDRGVACGWSIGSRRSGCPASKCWSSRSRSTASCWSCAAPASRDALTETDPQALGKPPLPGEGARAGRGAGPPRRSTRSSSRRAASSPTPRPANMVLLRGFDRLAGAAAIPRGLRRCARRPSPPIRCIAGSPSWSAWTCSRPAPPSPTRSPPCASTGRRYDFFFVHYKDTDKAGEDGDFDAKVEALERFDAFIPAVRALGPDVLVVTGDHATPSILAAPRLAAGAGAGLEPLLRRRPGHRVHRARLRGGHAGRACPPIT